MLLGWVIVFAMALPFWRDLQQQAAERTLGEEFDARIYAAQPRGISVVLRNVDELRLARATRLLNRLDELALNLSDTRINSLEPLRGLTSLSSLSLGNTGITSLEPLKGLTSLSSLSLGRTGTTSLEALRGLTRLSYLNLTSTGITDLEPLRGLTGLSTLNLSGAEGITTLEPLKGMKVLVEGASDELRATIRRDIDVVGVGDRPFAMGASAASFVFPAARR